MILERIPVGSMGTNCYILAKAKASKALIIDPGANYDGIMRILDKHKLDPGIVINTHGHYDHIACDDKFAVPIYVHKEDAKLLKDPKLNLSGLFFVPYSVKGEVKLVEEGDIISLDGISLKAIHIPGHTPGGMALLMLLPQDRILFSGDTLFYRSVGRSDLAGGSSESLIKAIHEKLFTLPEDTVVYPGHGADTTIGQEKKENPFL